MPEVVLSLGSNCGDRRKNVEDALRRVGSVLEQAMASGTYETPCAGKEGSPYINAVLKGNYRGNIEDLEKQLKLLETGFGRTSECKAKGEVPIDIDIVMADGNILRDWDYRQKFFRIGYEQISGNNL